MIVKDLQRNKKSRRSVLFRRKVVEIYRAEISSQHEIHQSLYISQTELRQMNRWYFKHRLRPYFSLSFYNITTMKKKTICY